MKIMSALAYFARWSAKLQSFAESATSVVAPLCFAAVLVAACPDARAAIAVQDFYRLGESDPGAVSGGVATKHAGQRGHAASDDGSHAELHQRRGLGNGRAGGQRALDELFYHWIPLCQRSLVVECH